MAVFSFVAAVNAIPAQGSAFAPDNNEDKSIAFNYQGGPFEDLGKFPGTLIPEDKIVLVPLKFQWEALKLLNGARVVDLTRAQAQHFSGDKSEEGRTPYLVQACLITVDPPRPPSQTELNQDLFERKVAAGHFSAIYIRQKELLLAYSFGLAPREKEAEPVVFVVWHDEPIREVRAFPAGAE